MKKFLLLLVVSILPCCLYADTEWIGDVLVERDGTGWTKAIHDESYESLTSIYISGDIDEIGEEAFRDCFNLRDIYIDEGVKIIGDYAFYSYNYINYESVHIPSTITTIGRDAFSNNWYHSDLAYGCAEKLYITDLEAWMKILFMTRSSNPGGDVYLNGELLTSLEFDHYTSIPSYACSKWTSLEDINFNNVMDIGEDAFAGCPNVKSVYIPVSYRGDLSTLQFASMNSLESIEVEAGHPGYFSYDGCLYEKTRYESTLVTVPAGKTTMEFDPAPVVPIKSIGSYAFYECNNLIQDTLRLPDSVETIRYSAFENTTINTIFIPQSVKTIYPWGVPVSNIIMAGGTITVSNTPFGITMMSDFPDKVYFGANFKSDYSNENIDESEVGCFGNVTLAHLAKETFNASYMNSLKYLYVHNSSVPDIQFRTEHFNNLIVYVPEEYYEDYKADEKFSQFKFLYPWKDTEVDPSDMDSYFFVDTFTDDNGFVFNHLSDRYNICELSGIYYFGLKNWVNGTDFIIPATREGSSHTVIGINMPTLMNNSYFKTSNIATLEIPESVEYISESSFAYFRNLTTVKCRATTPPQIKASISHRTVVAPFDANVYKTATLIVPQGAEEAYRTADYWKNFTIISGSDWSGIDDIAIGDDELTPAGYFDLNGISINEPHKGINIVKYNDGSARKIVVR